MTVHSERAKKNTRDAIDLRILTIESRIKGIKEEIRINLKYGHTAWTRRLNTMLRRKHAKRVSQLRRYKARRARLLKEGKI